MYHEVIERIYERVYPSKSIDLSRCAGICNLNLLERGTKPIQCRNKGVFDKNLDLYFCGLNHCMDTRYLTVEHVDKVERFCREIDRREEEKKMKSVNLKAHNDRVRRLRGFSNQA